MPYEHDNEHVDAIHQACGDRELPDVLAALVTVVVDAIHHIEHDTVRAEIEAAFIKCLQYVSAVENQFHGESVIDTDREFDALHAELLRRVRYRLFVGDENPSLMTVDHQAIVYRQIGAARELVGWSQEQLADRAGVSLEAVVQVERGEADDAPPNITLALHSALSKAGAEFLPGVTGSKGEGVMLRWPTGVGQVTDLCRP
jgi:DNA-binding XRE family transcriptional regulator